MMIPREEGSYALGGSSMEKTSMQRRNLVLAAAALVTGATRAQQHSGTHHTLPVAPSSPDPYAKLQGGVLHHMTPEQESQRVTDSPTPAGPRGCWVARAALPIPRSEMAWATAAMGASNGGDCRNTAARPSAWTGRPLI
jgi:hypothetical protein